MCLSCCMLLLSGASTPAQMNSKGVEVEIDKTMPALLQGGAERCGAALLCQEYCAPSSARATGLPCYRPIPRSELHERVEPCIRYRGIKRLLPAPIVAQ